MHLKWLNISESLISYYKKRILDTYLYLNPTSHWGEVGVVGGGEKRNTVAP